MAKCILTKIQPISSCYGHFGLSSGHLRTDGDQGERMNLYGVPLRMVDILPLLTLGGFFLLPVVASAQTTRYVDDDCTPPGSGTEVDPFCTIQDGVDAAGAGDTVLVQPGTYSGEGNRDIRLFGKPITVTSSAGPFETIIDVQGGAGGVHTGFYLTYGETSDSVIDGLSIINGYLAGDTGGAGVYGGGGGAAIFVYNGSPTIRNCIMKDNFADLSHIPWVYDGRGGAILIEGGSRTIIENCALLNNTGNFGGGIYVHRDCFVTLRNCVVAGNHATNRGGGIHNRTYGGALFFVNTSVWGNTSALAGGGLYSENSDTYFSNSILYENSAGSLGPQMFVLPPAVISFRYSALEGGAADIGDCCGYWTLIWGPGNIDADPLFVDPKGWDYRLSAGSPCIDAGDNFAVPGDLLVDLDGFARFADHLDTPDTGNGDGVLGIVDMGPYELGSDDCNNNGTPDTEDVAKGDSDDCDGNTIPDECEPDCNHNGQADLCDLNDGLSDDCDANIRPDECQIDAGSPAPGGPFYCIVETNSCDPDCNTNGLIDECDIAAETSIDCNANVVPDECEPDCNDNGQADECDITDGLSDDCNFNVVPDECEITIPILEQPQDRGAEPGEMVFFGVTVDAVLPDYQWRRDGVDLQDDGRIIGSQGPLLVIMEVIPEDAGEYDCVIIDLITACENTSDAATLNVHGPCPADFDNDGAVRPFDLAFLLGYWGPNPNHPADLNADGTVGPLDLSLLLGAWGPCP